MHAYGMHPWPIRRPSGNEIAYHNNNKLWIFIHGIFLTDVTPVAGKPLLHLLALLLLLLDLSFKVLLLLLVRLRCSRRECVATGRLDDAAAFGFFTSPFYHQQYYAQFKTSNNYSNINNIIINYNNKSIPRGQGRRRIMTVMSTTTTATTSRGRHWPLKKLIMLECVFQIHQQG